MIEISNNKDTPVEIFIDNDIIHLEGNASTSYDFCGDSLTFTVFEKDEKASFLQSLAGYLLIILLSVIYMIGDEFLYLKIKNFISLPVKVKLSDIRENTVVIINNSVSGFQYASVSANCACETEVVFDKAIIQKQVKQYHKECACSLVIPVLPIVLLTVYTIISKNTVATIVLIVVIIGALYAWYYNHKKNQAVINKLLEKAHSE